MSESNAECPKIPVVLLPEPARELDADFAGARVVDSADGDTQIG
jgi:hypothetical protein